MNNCNLSINEKFSVPYRYNSMSLANGGIRLKILASANCSAIGLNTAGKLCAFLRSVEKLAQFNF